MVKEQDGRAHRHVEQTGTGWQKTRKEEISCGRRAVRLGAAKLERQTEQTYPTSTICL